MPRVPRKRNPVVPFQLFKINQFTTLVLVAFLTAIGMFGAIIFAAIQARIAALHLPPQFKLPAGSSSSPQAALDPASLANARAALPAQLQPLLTPSTPWKGGARLVRLGRREEDRDEREQLRRLPPALGELLKAPQMSGRSSENCDRQARTRWRWSACSWSCGTLVPRLEARIMLSRYGLRSGAGSLSLLGHDGAAYLADQFGEFLLVEPEWELPVGHRVRGCCATWSSGMGSAPTQWSRGSSRGCHARGAGSRQSEW